MPKDSSKKWFVIYSEDYRERYDKKFNSYSECRDWVVSHLDLSMNWTIREKEEKDGYDRA